ncbi:hypothetical protein TNCV_4480051 [Trichonephila clavipes]|nr:hypothetical protein TNCV_4480051 [Trichonephila clavipes]
MDRAYSKNEPRTNSIKHFNATPSNKRPKGRPKTRWKDCVGEDFVILKVKNWRLIAGRRAEWKNTSEEGSDPQKATMLYVAQL